ncbi:MAG: hypothetical protein JSS86_11820 [Cyanobacteria bacterium SZAS LIN-2]|nr:hypothetical protein [Cyanobacteria bacterium SZAS LIN-2]
MILFLYTAVFIVLLILKLRGWRFSWWWVSAPLLIPLGALTLGLLSMVGLGLMAGSN